MSRIRVEELEDYGTGEVFRVSELARKEGTLEVVSGEGSPEGVVAARPGSIYTNSLGGAGTTLWVKETGTGTTGWVAK